jgi:hypothetical protein
MNQTIHKARFFDVQITKIAQGDGTLLKIPRQEKFIHLRKNHPGNFAVFETGIAETAIKYFGIGKIALGEFAIHKPSIHKISLREITIHKRTTSHFQRHPLLTGPVLTLKCFILQ